MVLHRRMGLGSGVTRGPHDVMRQAVRWFGAAALLMLTACEPGVLNPRGVVGVGERAILLGSVAIMLAIVVPTVLATFGFAWWFRAANRRAKHLPTWSHSGRIELIVWAIPTLTIILLGGVAWIGSHVLDPKQALASEKPAIEVQGVSLDWKWLFIYPDQHVASVNQLVVPAGVPIHFSLTSASVLNAFFIPQLGSMIYTMNGMTSELNLQADAPGEFRGISSHFSGDGFPGMHFQVRAVPAEDFASWVASTRQSGPTLDPAAYAELSKQTTDVAPFTYKDATPGLYQGIVSQKLPPGPGPSDPAMLKPGR